MSLSRFILDYIVVHFAISLTECLMMNINDYIKQTNMLQKPSMCKRWGLVVNTNLCTYEATYTAPIPIATVIL